MEYLGKGLPSRTLQSKRQKFHSMKRFAVVLRPQPATQLYRLLLGQPAVTLDGMAVRVKSTAGACV